MANTAFWWYQSNMRYWPNRSEIFVTFYSLIAGAIGAGIAYYLSFPVFVLTGPALLISIGGMMGARFEVTPLVRDVVFLFIGVGIGTSVNSSTTDAIIRWPLAFIVLAIVLLAILLISRALLTRFFGFDPRSAVLAATPGHLSYVLSLGASLNVSVDKIAVSQSIRVLILTLVVPFIAIAFGVEMSASILPAGTSLSTPHLLGLLGVAFVVGLVLKRLKVPAPLLIGGMLTSSAAHLSEITPGVLSPEITLLCFTTMGTLIGTRFSGVTLAQLRISTFAGLTTTFVAVVLSALAAFPVAIILGMSSAHVLVAFAPGGLETMIAIGAMMGANPGFVAACHVGRLLLLTVLMPFVLARTKA